MAKASQDEGADIGRQSSQPGSQSAGRESFGGREFQQAGRDTQSAARNAQAGISELLTSTMSMYSDLAREMENASRQWTQGVRMSLEQTFNVGLRANETFVEQARRTSDVCLRLCETGASLQRSVLGEIQGRAQRQGNGGYRHTAE